jgi:hypothetical protein
VGLDLPSSRDRGEGRWRLGRASAGAVVDDQADVSIDLGRAPSGKRQAGGYACIASAWWPSIFDSVRLVLSGGPFVFLLLPLSGSALGGVEMSTTTRHPMPGAPSADGFAHQADTLTSAPYARLSRYAEVEELEAPATPLVPTTGPQATRGALIPATKMTGYANTRGAAVVTDSLPATDDLTAVADEILWPADRADIGVLKPYHDDRSTLRNMFEVTTNRAMPMPVRAVSHAL